MKKPSNGRLGDFINKIAISLTAATHFNKAYHASFSFGHALDKICHYFQQLPYQPLLGLLEEQAEKSIGRLTNKAQKEMLIHAI